jgi:hypothetical protein
VADHTAVAVYRIDPQTAKAIRIDPDPDHLTDHGGPLVPGIGGPWYGPFRANSDVRQWTHIDAATNKASTPAPLQRALAQLGPNGASWIAETAAGVWGAASDIGAIDVVEFDRHDGHELRRVTLPGPATPAGGPRLLVAAFGSVWVLADGGTVMVQIDPSKGSIVGAVALTAPSVGIAVGDHALYLSGSDASIARVDPATDCVTAVQFLGGAATDPATNGDLIASTQGTAAVYVAYDRGALAVLDPTTLAVRKAFRIDTQESQGALTTTGTVVWYPTFQNDTILQIRP